MNEFSNLKDAWGEPDAPSQATHTAARAVLMRRIASDGTPSPRRPRRAGVRLGWLAGGTTMTATLAVAIAFAVAPAPPRPAHSPSQVPSQSASQSTSQLSGQQVLLAAAKVAESRPALTGAYWHTKEQLFNDMLGRLEILDIFTARDGSQYSMPEGYTGVLRIGNQHGFHVGGSLLSFGQLQQLPTDPDELRAWLKDSYLHPSRPSPVANDDGHIPPILIAKPLPESEIPGAVAFALTSLLYEVPAPPAVRAAAFRALATMPDVTNLGAMDGGEGLRIAVTPPAADKFPNGKVPAGANEVRLVIDPATSTLISYTNYQGTIKYLLAESTNDMPKVIE